MSLRSSLHQRFGNLAYRVAPLVSKEMLGYAEILGRFAHRADWRSGLGESLYTLYGIARTLRPACIVEIGSARGRSTCALALACRQNNSGRVFAIDPHTPTAWSDTGAETNTYEFLREKLQRYGLQDYCEIIRSTSQEALANWTRKIDMAFIDGDHTYEGVKTDFELCRPHLTEHALVVFHDTIWEHRLDDPNTRPNIGVPRFLEELKQGGYQSVTLFSPPGLSIVQARPGGFDYLNRAKSAVT
jgi:predicted O-methyltransferase YrrM